MKVHRDGLGTILVAYLGVLAICGSVIYFVDCLVIRILAGIVGVVPVAFLPYFFRVPKRECICENGLVTSAADGKVVIIKKVYEGEHLKREAIQVSVFMDFFNVHVNFYPLSGIITYFKYHPGKYLLAFKPKASEENERTSIGMKCFNGQEILFRQIAGTFARRIVSYAEVGDEVEGATQCGLIKFGSRVDIFLPVDAEICVQLGEEVRACETVIAKLSSCPEN